MSSSTVNLTARLHYAGADWPRPSAASGNLVVVTAGAARHRPPALIWTAAGAEYRAWGCEKGLFSDFMFPVNEK